MSNSEYATSGRTINLYDVQSWLVYCRECGAVTLNEFIAQHIDKKLSARRAESIIEEIELLIGARSEDDA